MGNPNKVTPPIIIPVTSLVCSDLAKDILPTDINSFNLWLTSSFVEALIIAAAKVIGSFLEHTIIVLADLLIG